ncbi:MAG: hypothetical protein ACFCVF_15745 [Kineosporiaceae bacterium]
MAWAHALHAPSSDDLVAVVTQFARWVEDLSERAGAIADDLATADVPAAPAHNAALLASGQLMDAAEALWAVARGARP